MMCFEENKRKIWKWKILRYGWPPLDKSCTEKLNQDESWKLVKCFVLWCKQLSDFKFLDWILQCFQIKKRPVIHQCDTLERHRTVCCKTFPITNGQPARREKQKGQRKRWSVRNRRSGWCFHQHQRWSHRWGKMLDTVCMAGMQWSLARESDIQKSPPWSFLGLWG